MSSSRGNGVGAESDNRQATKKQLPVIIESASGKGSKIKLFADPATVEAEAMKQLIGLAESGATVGHVAVMPDVHVGKGAVVGSVFASRHFVAPNAVGVDIGCGMAAVVVRGLYRDLPLPLLRDIQARVKASIPCGFQEYDSPLPAAEKTIRRIGQAATPTAWLQRTLSRKHLCQLGTLGGGNHFLELVYDELDRVWILLHSGSRNIGNVTATYSDQLARNLASSSLSTEPQRVLLHQAKSVSRQAPLKQRQLIEKRNDKAVDADGRHDADGEKRKEGKEPEIPRPHDPNLNFLRIESEEGQAYLKDMEWCQQYAMANRAAMLQRMKEIVEKVTGCRTYEEEDEACNIHHNYCRCEQCSYLDERTGQQVTEPLWITRKGATSARAGELGIIPGSMATGSYLVRGKGHPDSWSSCSHGAGRRLSRTAAFAAISQRDFEASLTGIVADSDYRLRDEAPQAYKDLHQVIADQADLIEVVHHFRPLVNVKGIDKNPRQLKTKH